ncbi:MAG: flavodoxin domain-containing protein [Acidobacteriota bacterium]|nr:flavodoxin domain-containing protein [Acidobacteriota bacterium]
MSQPNILSIPDTAPFTPEQRAWLNGFLSGLVANTPATSEAKAPALRFGIYFATQSGTAERLAKKAAKELKAQGHAADILSLEKVSPADLATQSHALFFASTYGEGDPPDGATLFRHALFSEEAQSLERLRFAVFALGDSHYENFCKFGVEIDERLHSLGGSRILPRVESDVNVDEPFESWKKDLLTRLTDVSAAESSPAATIPSSIHDTSASTHTRENPFFSPILERTALTSDVSSKLTMHLSFGLADSGIRYEAGDACGVIAKNDPDLVTEILAELPFSGSDMLALPKVGSVSVESALLHHLQPTRLTRKIVQAFANKAECKGLAALLPVEQSVHLDAYMHARGLIDLLLEFPGVITVPADLVAMLPGLAPRLYSISSSPAAHPNEVHCTIAVVRYRSHNRERGGVASTMLADRVPVGSHVPIYIQPNKRFRLPADSNTPIIMIGPGTGIAPFRAFLHERRALGHQGRNWLFFGERSADTDFLYCPELLQMSEDGHLTRFDTAFSRDQSHKIYVQDRMLEQGADLWQWLNDGAQIFVCGDALRMAKDVDAALHHVIEQHGGMSAEAAQEYVSQLHDDRRYHRDIY